MKRILARGMPTLAGLCAAALALFAVAQPGPSPHNLMSAASAIRPAAPAPASTAPAWTGSFSGFNTSAWDSSWGTTSNSAQCAGASGTFSCNWGYSNMQAGGDSTAPGGGPVLKVTYPAKSGPPSCYLTVSGCVLGGGQFYQDLTTNGETALAQSPSLDLKYDYNFPVGFDFGGKTAGKMPGLWGGGVMGCESGAQHCAQGWSTRYMWKGGSSTAPNGELYFYTSSGSGYGADLCNGNWKFAADGTWHSIEQQVNINTGSITIWSDGTQVCQVTEPMPGANSGIFFSTFHGGHDLSYSPSKTVTAEFADFSLATAGPQSTIPTTPASPSGVTASATSGSSIALSWAEQNNSDPAASYKVYEGSTVVATSTSTSATITGLASGSTHAYTVTAVDGSGVESAHSAAVTATTSGGGGGLSVTLAKSKDWGSGYTDTATLTNTSGSAVNGWNVQFDLNASENIESSTGVSYACSASHCTLTNLSSDATVAPGASLTFQFSGDYPSGGHYSAPTNVTAYALGGGSQSPATPTGLTVTGTTNTSVSLSWTESNNSDPAASYRVYEGSNVVASPTATSATISGLTAGTSYSFTAAAVDASAVQSPQSASITATTSGSTGGAKFSQTDIDSAVASPLIAFAAPTSSVPRPGTNPTNIGESAVLQYLALVDKEQPGATASNGTTVDSALLAQVRDLIAGGNEPDADGGLEGWSHALVAEALLVVKNGPAWSELTATEQNKVTLLEAAMGYAGNHTYNDANNFSSGICGFGNFSKTNNPNYRDGYVDVELAAIQYFGASTWTSMLQNFNDANEVSALTAAGLTNAAGCYKTVGSAADGAIGRPFVYQGVAAADLMGLWNVLASDTFDLTVTSSVSGTASGSSVTAHIADNTTSPEQGKTGMGKEFDSTDSQGLRSSALYVFEGWMNVTGSRLAMTALGNFSCSAASAAAPYQVGSLDLIYKLHHGYVGYALNQSGVLVNDSGSPSADGPNVKGYQYDLDSYNNLIGNQGC